MCLLHSSELSVEVFGQKNYAVNLLPCHESARLLKVVAPCCYTHVGRSVDMAHELTARLTVAIVDHSHRHLAHHLIIVNP